MKVVIIGGVAGGATAAARIRRLDEQAEIIVFERSGYISYANCGLPYFIGGVIEDAEELTLQTPESFWSRFRKEKRFPSKIWKPAKRLKKVTISCFSLSRRKTHPAQASRNGPRQGLYPPNGGGYPPH